MMTVKTKNEVIDILARSKTVETLLGKISHGSFPHLDDLAQDIYLSLLLKDDDKIVSMYNDKQLLFYIIRIIRNNLYSTTSPYWRQYRRYTSTNIDLDSIDVSNLPAELIV